MIKIISAILLFVSSVTASCSISVPLSGTSFVPGSTVPIVATFLNAPNGQYNFSASLTPAVGSSAYSYLSTATLSSSSYQLTGSIVVPSSYGLTTLTVAGAISTQTPITCSVNIFVNSYPCYPCYPNYGCYNPCKKPCYNPCKKPCYNTCKIKTPSEDMPYCNIPKRRRRCYIAGEDVDGSEQTFDSWADALIGEEEFQQQEQFQQEQFQQEQFQQEGLFQSEEPIHQLQEFFFF